MDTLTGNRPILEIALIVIMAPLIEEIVYRGAVLRRLLGMKLFAPAAVCLQALLFGVIHANMVQGIYAFAVGIVMGAVYVWSKSIWAPLAMHVTFNLTGVLTSYLPESGEGAAQGGDGVWILITFASMVIVAVLLMLIRKRCSENT
jgi:membrane protease YdiL (CAAX protease family)